MVERIRDSLDAEGQATVATVDGVLSFVGELAPACAADASVPPPHPDQGLEPHPELETNAVLPKIKALVQTREVPDNLWRKYPACEQMIFHRELDKILMFARTTSTICRLRPPAMACCSMTRPTKREVEGAPVDPPSFAIASATPSV